MREYQEKVEDDLENLESQTEQVEQRMEQVEDAIQELEASISRLEGKGDQEVASAIQKNLAERLQEKDQEQQQAQEIARQLQQVQNRIREIDQWNNEAHQEVAKLEGLHENMDEAASRIADRERWVEAEDEKTRSLQQRLDKVIGNYG